MEQIESGKFYTKAEVAKYYAVDLEGKTLEEVEPYEITDAGQPGNLLVNVGINQLMSRLATAEQVWDPTHSGIAVGDSSTAATAAQTNLQAATNKRYNQCETGYPVAAGSQTLQFRAIFDTVEANFAWQEYALIIPDTTSTFTEGSTLPSNYVLLNRKVASLGTKTLAEVWVLTVTLTIV